MKLMKRLTDLSFGEQCGTLLFTMKFPLLGNFCEDLGCLGGLQFLD